MVSSPIPMPYLNVLTKRTLVTLGKTVQRELSYGGKFLYEHGSMAEFHKINLVRNFARMLEVHFPQYRSLITVLSTSWDSAEYKSAKEAIKLVDELVDLVLYDRIVPYAISL